MKRIFKFLSMMLCFSMLFSFSVSASDITSGQSISDSKSDIVIDYEENFRESNYYDDVIYEEEFITEIVSPDKMGRAVASPCKVSFYIHYNDTRGAWLSVLIDAQDKTTESSMISSVSGNWLYAFDGGTTQRKNFDETILIKRWTVNIEYNLGKLDSGTQIYGGVNVSAKMVYGYMPECSRAAVATVP